jgi:alkylhydroperoxidase family enzyme
VASSPSPTFYRARERAAVAWCEALTLLPQHGAPDDVDAELETNFSPDEITALTVAVVAINGLAVGLTLTRG